MKRPGMILLLALFLASTLAVVSDTGAQDDNLPSREKAAKLFKDGNWKEAYDLYSKLALDPKDEPNLVGNDLNNAVNCLQRLGRRSEIDAFLEKVIKAHSGNWRLLWAAAQRYLNIQHNGFIVAGEFNRGSKRGGGKYVDSYERDRTRALQLMVLAMGKNKGETDRTAVGRFYRSFSNMLITSRYGQDAWRLQYLSNLSELPDYDEGRRYWYGYRQRGAPVNPDGTPVYHHLPKSWKESKTDGERWRWCLMQAAEYNPSLKAQLRYQFAGFLHNQFGVRTMAGYGWRFGRGADDDKKDESGPYALTTLGEDETISRLATGIKRFKLLDEFNFIKIYQQIAKENKGYGENALNALAGIFEDRQQYPKAADYWRRNIREFREKSWKRRRLNQITGNWGMFEPVMTQPAGSGAGVEFRFRNGQKVSFKAHEINITKLLRDVKEYLKTRPKKLDWQKTNIANLGYRLVTKNQRKYIVKRVAAWDLDLKPRPKHFDKRITVATPLQKAGAYLLTAKMKGGNTTHIIIWVADTVIVKKQLDKQLLFYVADAESGKPVAKANLEFFGYWQKWVRDDKRGQGHYELHLKNLAEFTDADGQVILAEKRLPRNYQYIITATTPKGRLAYLGWTGVWYGTRYDREYKATKAFLITDRPVYRPKHTVKFKFWVNHAKYDQEGKSAFAGRNFTVRIRNPKNEKVFEKSFKADDYGGVSGEFTLPKGAALGMYRIHIPGKGGGSFRVEEYKKPEFEVTIEAPKEPVMLGEKITATISAKYLFGAPVKEAKVKYKVLRTSHDARWYPWGIWDWYYSPGYWWYAYDYTWYPGWWEWGCRRPWPWWRWGGRWGPREQPEVVSENEVEIGPDGMLKIEIDTAVAKAIHPDIDHKYEITAEVTDKSRRTIVGTGTVLVARRPFKVYAWVDRGHYRVGDTVRASFRAQTLDNKPVKGKGVLKLLRIKYNKDKRPVETLVRKWSLDTNVEGVARQQIKASRAGQYRLSYTLTDSKKHKIEGGYVFIIAGRGFDSSEFRFNDIELVTDKREYKPGEKVSLRVNTNRTGGTVLLFLRPANGICLPPKVLRLKGKSAVEEIEVAKKDMPNFFVEALTVHGGKVHTEVREVIVPPESRILKVEVTPSAKRYKPGEKAKIKVKLIDSNGEPFVGSTVIAMYDKAVEYISGGSNVPDIKEFFWKWRRRHQPRTEHSLNRGGNNTVASGKDRMTFLGAFGHMSVNLPTADGDVEAQIGLGMKAKQMRLPASGMGYAEGRESLMEQSAG
ncbi:MAG: MG2 domain-containing protein, partial [Planctomycetia bacterium]|nr:MG2 domain-containing protein [Planctomycetia bacterium]